MKNQVTVTLTDKQVGALLELASYGEDYVEGELEHDDEYKNLSSVKRREYRATLKHGIAARLAIYDAQTHAPASLARSLSKRLAWQGFDITTTEED